MRALSNDAWTSLSVTLMPWRAASESSHCARIRNDMTWPLSCSYCVLQEALYCASVVFGWPLTGFGAVALRSAMHFVKFGGSGMTTLAPVWPPADSAAMFSQWS